MNDGDSQIKHVTRTGVLINLLQVQTPSRSSMNASLASRPSHGKPYRKYPYTHPSMERPISILLVQSETPQGDELCRNLVLAGWQVTSVRHPRQAMAACTLRHYDVVVIAHAPPTLDGIDLTNKLVRYASAPIVLLADDSTAEHDGREAGAIAYLCSPWLASDLYRTVNLALQTNMIGQP